MVEMRQTAGYGMTVDETARFLRELRQLRDYAGLGQAELAARAHYPRDYITAAEIGPAVPDLPLLSAYVRGCGGTVEEWEERWRALTNTPALTLLPTRSAGCSTAASAGARIGSVSPAADIPDPAVIMAALNRVAEKIAASTPSSRPSRSTLSPIAPRVATSAFLASTSAASGADVGTGAGVGTTAGAGGTGAHGGNGTTTAAPRPAVPGATTMKPADAAPTAGASATSGATNQPRTTTATAKHTAVGRRFRMTSRTTVAALVALAICVIVAVLAIFA